jgi:hypothetical protein
MVLTLKQLPWHLNFYCVIVAGVTLVKEADLEVHVNERKHNLTEG